MPSSTPSSSRTSSPRLDPFPTPYYLFFAGAEPFLTIVGALKAVLHPAHFHSTLIPVSLAPLLEAKTAHAGSIMAVRQLGNTYGLLALVAATVLPAMRRTLAGRPVELEAILRAYLGALAFADITHIGLTLYDLGLEGSLHPLKHWNQLVWGNVGITACLFAVRSLWFLGVGRTSASASLRRDRSE
ncbi:hypothetical protein JCM3775_004662 [Rhodotorula graminis]|uniref:DUF7704 domain-containing protein n=1 Tax=Rhodotorula graminis (strain WP1) TaxID=578459 RepID=A0A0P9EWL4_RHOGW|nr:uncharacterized protein RHOBADRAFT_54885 [Rhodotorula graminis WP1]KPV73691.1 hypothetical protein RHOBADRAFT_54885 [Rhodotorula graminis WP1]